MGWCKSRGTFAGALIALIVGGACSPATLAASLGQKNDFEDGGLAGWQVGSAGTGTSPLNVSSGGPAGTGDAFMRLTSTGGAGALSRLVVFNQSTWSGPYTSFDAISMDLANLGTTQVQMRIALQDTAFSQHVSTQP